MLFTTPTGADAVLNRLIPRLCSRMLYGLRVRMQRARACIRVGCRVIYQIIRQRKHVSSQGTWCVLSPSEIEYRDLIGNSSLLATARCTAEARHSLFS